MICIIKRIIDELNIKTGSVVNKLKLFDPEQKSCCSFFNSNWQKNVFEDVFLFNEPEDDITNCYLYPVTNWPLKIFSKLHS